MTAISTLSRSFDSARIGTTNVSPDTDGSPNSGRDVQGLDQRPPAVLVSISNQTKVLLREKSAPPSENTKFMPTRKGFDSNSLAYAVTDPSSEFISAGKTTDQVGIAARASLDSRYAAMAETGKAFDYNSWEGVDWFTLMGGLDRRALLAVQQNVGGQFTEQEQGIAQSMMQTQESLAMGLYAGPTSQQGLFRDPFAMDDTGAQRSLANANWLERVGSDEKRTFDWAYKRASAQIGYEWSFDENSGKKPLDLTSTNPLVNLIVTAKRTMKTDSARSWTIGTVNDATSLKQQPWFKGFEAELDRTLLGQRKS